MRQSLAFILMISLAGLQFLAILIVVFTTFVTSERAILQHALGLMSQAGSNATEHTRLFLKPAQDLAKLATGLIADDIIDHTDYDALEQLLFQQVLTEPQVAGVYFGDESGNFVYVMRSEGPGPLRTKTISHQNGDRNIEFIWRTEDFEPVSEAIDPTDQFDPRTRPWYQSAASTKQPIWTDPYVFFSSRRPGITAAVPVLHPEAGLIGVVGVDIELDAISRFLSELTISAGSTALILNENGEVIAHPASDQIVVQNEDKTIRFVGIDEINDPVARTAFGTLAQSGPLAIDNEIRSELEYEKESYLTLLAPIDRSGLPWTIAIHAPENDFIQRIKDNRRRNIWIAAIISLVTAIAGLMLAEVILRPVRAFAVRTSLVSQGEVPANLPPPKTYRELERANETLIHEIAQRRESEAKQRELSRQLFHFSRVDMMGQLASGLAHELSQPMTAITQNVDAAISTAAKLDHTSPELMQILSELDDQAHRGGDIIGALRGLVRKDKGDAAPFDFEDLLDQSIKIVQHEADANAVELIKQTPTQHQILANRVQIAQVLINLMHNAIEAMSSAGSTPRQIVISTHPRDTLLEVWVEDSGPGVDPEQRLFRHFETSKADGMGLGLSISKTIIETNGGHLWYDYNVTEKSRFCFTLPLLLTGLES